MEGATRTGKKLTALMAKLHAQASKIADSTEMSKRANAKQSEGLCEAKGQLKRLGKVYMVNRGASQAKYKAHRADPNGHRTGKTRTKLADKGLFAQKKCNAKARASHKSSDRGRKSGGKHSLR